MNHHLCSFDMSSCSSVKVWLSLACLQRKNYNDSAHDTQHHELLTTAKYSRNHLLRPLHLMSQASVTWVEFQESFKHIMKRKLTSHLELKMSLTIPRYQKELISILLIKVVKELS